MQRTVTNKQVTQDHALENANIQQISLFDCTQSTYEGRVQCDKHKSNRVQIYSMTSELTAGRSQHSRYISDQQIGFRGNETTRNKTRMAALA